MIAIVDIINVIYTTGDTRTVQAQLVADTVADLPTPSGIAGYLLTIGSVCDVIQDSTRYIMMSTGQWVQQLRDVSADVYTRAQVDAMVQQLAAAQAAQAAEIGVIANAGAKNILPIQAQSQTISGVQFTVDQSAGTITVTADGTQTSSAFLYIVPRSDADMRAKMLGRQLTLTGCPAGGSGSTFRLRCWHYSGTAIASDLGNGTTFTFDNSADPYDISIQVFPGAVLDNLVFYPMLRAAQIQDDTYTPYAPTNRELYEMI